MRASWTVIVGLTLSLSACDVSDAEGDTEGDTDAMGAGDSGADPSGGGDVVPSNAYCADVSSWDSTMTEFEEEVLILVNEARSQGANCGGQSFGPAGPLTMHPALRCAARVHSKDMAERNYFDHNNPDGEDPFVRMEQAGYSYFTAGENIAAGQPTPQAVMQGWMDSPGHCSNIMNPDFEDLGVGTFSGTGAQFGIYWTQAFGA
ncbi:MAG: CAP domain-containing protein [Nannocystaceae bacterium]|nr:CAP domain-containing protein [bacterium]